MHFAIHFAVSHRLRYCSEYLAVLGFTGKHERLNFDLKRAKCVSLCTSPVKRLAYVDLHDTRQGTGVSCLQATPSRPGSPSPRGSHTLLIPTVPAAILGSNPIVRQGAGDARALCCYLSVRIQHVAPPVRNHEATDRIKKSANSAEKLAGSRYASELTLPVPWPLGSSPLARAHMSVKCIERVLLPFEGFGP